ncbi:MAG: M23 family metallopeptidase [Gemmatimonadota bacterium]
MGALAVVLLAALAFTLLARRHPASPSPAALDVKIVQVPTPPPLRTVSDTLGRGETLAELLDERGVSGTEAYSIIQAIRPYRDPRTLHPGLVVRFTGREDESPQRIDLLLDADASLHLALVDSSWAGRLDSVPVTVDTLYLAGRIRTSLWETELLGDADRLSRDDFAQFIWGLSSQVYPWKIDFSREIWAGDSFRFVVERVVRPDSSMRSFRFLATEFQNRDRDLTAIPFVRPDGRREYYAPDGASMRGVFLRAPVEFRMTSGFSRRRYHPILRRRRPHLGTDYGAPRGAPVVATGDGTVTRAGRWGTYGRMVEIRHAGGIRTRYAHLSSIPSSIRVGRRVKQGQVIGRVGATGLATAPHLHYEFLVNGAQRNPTSVDLPAAPALEAEYADAFAVVRDRAMELLDRIPLPGARPAGADPPAEGASAD